MRGHIVFTSNMNESTLARGHFNNRRTGTAVSHPLTCPGSAVLYKGRVSAIQLQDAYIQRRRYSIEINNYIAFISTHEYF